MALTPPTRYSCRQRRESFSVPPVTGQAGTDRECRNARSRPRPGSTTSVWGRHPRRVASRRGPRRRRGVAVPAMALTESTGEAVADRQVSSIPSKRSNSTARAVGGRPTTDSKPTSRSRMRRGRANRSGSAGCVAQLATAPPDRNRPRLNQHIDTGTDQCWLTSRLSPTATRSRRCFSAS